VSEQITPPDNVWNRKRKEDTGEGGEGGEGKDLILMLALALMLAWTVATLPPGVVCNGKPVVAQTVSPPQDLSRDGPGPDLTP